MTEKDIKAMHDVCDILRDFECLDDEMNLTAWTAMVELGKFLNLVVKSTPSEE